MTLFVDIVLIILFIIALIIVTFLFGVFGLYEHIMGPEKVEKLFQKLHIPLSYKQATIIGFICLALMMVTCILIAKRSGSL